MASVTSPLSRLALPSLRYSASTGRRSITLARPSLIRPRVVNVGLVSHLHSYSFSPLRTCGRAYHIRLLSSYPSHTEHKYGDLAKDATWGQRLKYLIKKYGWYALGVYSVVGIVNFGVTFAAVSWLGAERVAGAAAAIKSAMYREAVEDVEQTAARAEEAERDGMYATAVIALMLHKTLLLPLRVGVTAAFTPKLVGFLRARGWAGPRGTLQASREMRQKAQDMRERKKGH